MILKSQSWFTYDSLAPNWPQDVHNLHGVNGFSENSIKLLNVQVNTQTEGFEFTHIERKCAENATFAIAEETW